MKKQTLSERLRAYDAENFDLTDKLPLDEPVRRIRFDLRPEDLPPAAKLERDGVRVFRALYPWMAGLLAAVMILFLLLAVLDMPAYGDPGAPANNEVTERYLARGMEETGAVNAVAGVILDYRAFDTLGESHVLFTAAAAVLILLLTAEHVEPESRSLRDIMEKDPILRTTARVVVPVVLLFGMYIIVCGHLGPGGGFAGGAVLGGGLILCVIAFGFEPLERYLDMKTYCRVIAACLCFYSLAKCYSFYCGANGLETVFGPGTPGRILSAGLILPLNIAVGLVVACTMYGFYSVFRRGKI